MKQLILPFLALAMLAFSCDKTNIIEDIIAPENLHNRAVGASAKEYLAAEKYKSVHVQIQYMTGFAPDAQAIENLRTFLSTYLNKPNGITITTSEITGSTANALGTAELINIEKANRTAFSEGDKITVYILYTNGEYTSTNTLGVAYRNTSVALFGKKIHDNTGGLFKPSRTKLETTVLTHEMGHLLGLVNIGTPMQATHEDGSHKGHCNNSNCLMYYTAETTEALGGLINGAVPALDAACIADLKSNGGK